MTYSKATEILGFTTPKSLAANAERAESWARRNHGQRRPLRYLVACDVLINAAK